MTTGAATPPPPPPFIDDGTPVEQLVLLNTFTIRKRVHRVVLHDGQLVWQEERSNDRTVLPLTDLISVRLTPPDAATSANTTTSPSLLLHYARRNHATSGPASNVWRVHSRRLCHPDDRTVRLWADALRRHLAASQPRRPRHLLVFVNPFGGRQQSLRIFEKWAKPLFELAGCETDVVVSQRPNQIGDILRRHRLDGLDGVVCVGGDGTVSEMLNGLVQRAVEDPTSRAARDGHDAVLDEKEEHRMPVAGGETEQWTGVARKLPRPALPVGIIPGGSTDTIAYCLHGTTDIRTAVIHIVLGQRTGLDLASVSDAGGRLIRLYASVMSYGFLGDVAADSERFRWMGPRRYDYSGFKKFVANRGYEGEILIPDDDEGDDASDERNPNDGMLCVEQCPRCAARAPAVARRPVAPPAAAIPVRNPLGTVSGEPTSSSADGYEESIGPDGTVRRWRVLRGKFFMVNGANLSCACPKSPNGFSRFGHVGDGRVDLVLVRHTPMLHNLRLLQKLSSRTDRISELPFVEIHRVRRFRFRAAAAAASTTSASADDLDTASVMNASTDRVVKDDADRRTAVHDDRRPSSQWNCDGEVITDSDISVESNCQLVNVFRRGPIAPAGPSESACGRLSLCGF